MLQFKGTRTQQKQTPFSPSGPLFLPSHFLIQTHVLLKEVVLPHHVCVCLCMSVYKKGTERRSRVSAGCLGAERMMMGWPLVRASPKREKKKPWRTWKPRRSSILCHLVSFTEVEWGEQVFHGATWANYVKHVETHSLQSTECVCVWADSILKIVLKKSFNGVSAACFTL